MTALDRLYRLIFLFYKCLWLRIKIGLTHDIVKLQRIDKELEAIELEIDSWECIRKS